MKNRLDVELCERGMVKSRSRATNMIKSGAVLVNGEVQTKGGYPVDSADEITISTEIPEFEIALNSVGRGAVKLSFALKRWGIVPEGLCIDVGASTGGFTEILLKNGADRVIAIDVGRGQLDRILREDARVILLEGVDIRTIASLQDLYTTVRLHSDENSKVLPTDEEVLGGARVITCDVSFISLTKVLPAVQRLGCRDCHYIFLIKPQFETKERKKRKKGIVNSPKDREDAVKRVLNFAASIGLEAVGVEESPITGGDGNMEYLAYFRNVIHENEIE